MIDMKKMNNKKNTVVAFCLLTAVGMSMAPNVHAALAANDNTASKATVSPGITGVVTGADGQALPGVVIKSGEGKAMAVTDADGRFTVNAQAGEKLSFSYLGYETVNDVAKPDMKVSMKDDIHTLKEVVVSTQKRNQTAVEVPVAVSAVTG